MKLKENDNVASLIDLLRSFEQSLPMTRRHLAKLLNKNGKLYSSITKVSEECKILTYGEYSLKEKKKARYLSQMIKEIGKLLMWLLLTLIILLVNQQGIR